ncbi:MAG: hypothetical protein M1837_000990 [Sclerophora amabilis]|nr:MAG: hypothetical protein M1837_000990 [Sclerophora amabilis]
MSVSNCARLGYAMGFRKPTEAAQMLPRPGTWTEQEERRRVWWGVMILDRYVALGGGGHPLVTEDPGHDELLPVDDSAWDEGRMGVNEPLFVSSATDVPAAPFARLCQASNLLGRVIRHTTDKIEDVEFHTQEALQLEKTIKALSALLPGELNEGASRLCTPMAFFYSALLTLYENYCCFESLQTKTPHDLQLQKISINGIEVVSKEVASFNEHLSTSLIYSLETIYPLISDCLYQAAANFSWRFRESGDTPYAELLGSLKVTMSKIDQRWAVAGEYIKMLTSIELALATGEFRDRS